jgi:hypothetical protein
MFSKTLFVNNAARICFGVLSSLDDSSILKPENEMRHERRSRLTLCLFSKQRLNLRPNKPRIHRESTRLDRHKNVILIVTNCGKNPA